MTERPKTLSRRNFLLAVGAGGAATAAAMVASRSPASKPEASSNGKRATRGYQSSEHTQNYYRTAKV